jgi:hypothetical protein
MTGRPPSPKAPCSEFTDIAPEARDQTHSDSHGKKTAILERKR